MSDKFVMADPRNRPWIGNVAHGYATFVHDNLMLILALVAALVLAIVHRLPRGSGDFRYQFLDRYIPPFTSYRTFQSSAFMLVLNALMKSGMLISDAIDEAVSQCGEWMTGYLYMIKARLQNSGQTSTVSALNVGFFDPRIMLRLESTAANQSIEGALEKLSEQGFRKILKQSRASSAVLGQIVMAYAGFSVVFVMAGMIEMAFALKGSM